MKYDADGNDSNHRDIDHMFADLKQISDEMRGATEDRANRVATKRSNVEIVVPWLTFNHNSTDTYQANAMGLLMLEMWCRTVPPTEAHVACLNPASTIAHETYR